MSRLSAKGVLIVIIFLMLPGLGSSADLALNYPTKPIKLIIPSQAGGGHDLTFRAVTSVSAEFLGQPILVQLEPGGLGKPRASVSTRKRIASPVTPRMR